MPLYLCTVKEETDAEGNYVSRGPDVPGGYGWSATYNEDLSQAVIKADREITGWTALTEGEDVGFDYSNLLVSPEEARPAEPETPQPAPEEPLAGPVDHAP